MCAKDEGLIYYGNYEPDMLEMGKSRIKHDPFFLLEQLDRW